MLTCVNIRYTISNIQSGKFKCSKNFLINLAESPKDASNKDSPASQSSVADSGVFSIQSNSPSKGDGTTSGTSPDSPNARFPDQQAFGTRDGHGQCKSSPFLSGSPYGTCGARLNEPPTICFREICARCLCLWWFSRRCSGQPSHLWRQTSTTASPTSEPSRCPTTKGAIKERLGFNALVILSGNEFQPESTDLHERTDGLSNADYQHGTSAIPPATADPEAATNDATAAA